MHYPRGLAAVSLFALALTGCEEDTLTLIESQLDVFSTGREERSATFEQNAAGQIDILWVIDNSESMEVEQQNLGTNFQAFLDRLTPLGFDYHVGVISTDMDDPNHRGRLQGATPVITPSPNASALFAQNVQVGIGGQAIEQGLLAAYTALTEPLISTDNAGFMRATAGLAIIFVSDEDDGSFGQVLFYDRELSRIKGVGNENRVQLAAIVGDAPSTARPDGGCSNAATGNAVYGERYHNLLNRRGGLAQSICSDDFSAILAELSSVITGLIREFNLGDGGVDDVTVFVDGTEVLQDPATGWTVASQTLLFTGDYVPPPGAIIEVTFGETQTEFVLSRAPAFSEGSEGEGIDVRVYPPEAFDCSAESDCFGGESCGLAGKCGGEAVTYGFTDGWVLESRTTAEGDDVYVVVFNGAARPEADATIQVTYRCVGSCI